ncbi:MAG: hypothetical protein WAK86_12120, partial [Pseudonocardiaceae bacterium]
VGARLVLEIALALLDRDAGDAAMQEARSLLRRPVRAAAAAAVGRLRLALATRVHLAEGRHEPALTLLADAVEGAQRYGVDAVLAECLEGLSHVHEARGEFADAVHCVRAARAAEGRHRHDAESARSVLLENCGSARRAEARLIGQVTALLGDAGTGFVGSDSDTGPLVEVAVVVEAQQSTAPEVAEPEIAESEAHEPEIAEPEIAEPESAQLTAPTLTPSAPDVAFAASKTSSSEPVDTQAGGNPPVAADPVSQEPVDEPSTEPSSGLNSWQSGARHRRGAGTLVSVSDLLPASALSAGRSGRRRAEERGDEPSTDGTDVPSDAPENLPPARQEFPASEPPPAPAPRALVWEAADGDAADDEGSSKMGLGDLLAEALAAYQESRDIQAEARTRSTVGLALAPQPIDASPGDPDGVDPAEAVTNPLLRLPDLTVEPRWGPPETGRRSAAGD